MIFSSSIIGNVRSHKQTALNLNENQIGIWIIPRFDGCFISIIAIKELKSIYILAKKEAIQYNVSFTYHDEACFGK